MVCVISHVVLNGLGINLHGMSTRRNTIHPYRGFLGMHRDRRRRWHTSKVTPYVVDIETHAKHGGPLLEVGAIKGDGGKCHKRGERGAAMLSGVWSGMWWIVSSDAEKWAGSGINAKSWTVERAAGQVMADERQRECERTAGQVMADERQRECECTGGGTTSAQEAATAVSWVGVVNPSCNNVRREKWQHMYSMGPKGQKYMK
jgi:hypothetical protein